MTATQIEKALEDLPEASVPGRSGEVTGARVCSAHVTLPRFACAVKVVTICLTRSLDSKRVTSSDGQSDGCESLNLKAPAALPVLPGALESKVEPLPTPKNTGNVYETHEAKFTLVQVRKSKEIYEKLWCGRHPP